MSRWCDREVNRGASMEVSGFGEGTFKEGLFLIPILA